MRGPSHVVDGSMVSPELALEHMSVEKAWTLLDNLSSQVVAKETELQVRPKERNTTAVPTAAVIDLRTDVSLVPGHKYPRLYVTTPPTLLPSCVISNLVLPADGGLPVSRADRVCGQHRLDEGN